RYSYARQLQTKSQRQKNDFCDSEEDDPILLHAFAKPDLEVEICRQLHRT
ncbi:3717_t:CDS:1, partial [Acaulospora colombiana]